MFSKRLVLVALFACSYCVCKAAGSEREPEQSADTSLSLQESSAPEPNGGFVPLPLSVDALGNSKACVICIIRKAIQVEQNKALAAYRDGSVRRFAEQQADQSGGTSSSSASAAASNSVVTDLSGKKFVRHGVLLIPMDFYVQMAKQIVESNSGGNTSNGGGGGGFKQRQRIQLHL